MRLAIFWQMKGLAAIHFSGKELKLVFNITKVNQEFLHE